MLTRVLKSLVFTLVMLPFSGKAQNFHLSGRVGIANYQGDLKAKSISFAKSKMLFSLGAKYDLTEHLSARGYLSLTGLQADDKDGTATMQLRNLSFRTSIIDLEMGAQYNLFTLNERWWTPYLALGVGFFHYKPYTKDINGDKVFLQPLSTEGQGFIPGSKKYKLTQFFLPIAIGGEYALSEDTRLGLEMGYRKLFTDYLDDVSDVYVDENALLSARGQQAVDLAYRGDEVGAGHYPPANSTRGNPKNKDGYYYVAITLTVRAIFDSYKRIAGLPAYKRDKKVGCPASRQ